MERAEAIKKIRQMSLPKETMEILEALAPELNESEDERIRKAIIGLIEELQRSEKNFAGVELTDMLAYLEKQNHDGKKWITPAELNRLLTLRYESGFNDGVRGEMKKQEDHFRDDTKMVEQKPAEWSEEDKKAFSAIEEAIGGYHSSNYACELVDWLKSLRPQPKKELSIEKAIQWLDDTFCFLDNSSGRGRDCEITTHDFDSLEEMYDSFRKAVTVDYRPSWKPSEEQMKAFCRCVDYLEESDNEDADIMAELYEQLKSIQ